MIGVAFLVVVCTVASVYLYAIDRRDERRRAERLARWYSEHGGGE